MFATTDLTGVIVLQVSRPSTDEQQSYGVIPAFTHRLVARRDGVPALAVALASLRKRRRDGLPAAACHQHACQQGSHCGTGQAGYISKSKCNYKRFFISLFLVPVLLI